jgi:hypothetical protein
MKRKLMRPRRELEMVSNHRWDLSLLRQMIGLQGMMAARPGDSGR